MEIDAEKGQISVYNDGSGIDVVVHPTETKNGKPLYIPEMIWDEQTYKSEDSVLLVLANTHYDINDYIEDYEQMLDNYYTHPTEQDSTALGEVPQAAEKGSMRPGYMYEPYWMSYMLQEQQEK